jgi:GT2 family glycosyltransferase
MLSFSVIIPSYNRPERLAACVEAFTRLDYRRDNWELIIVNDGGERTFACVSQQATRMLPLRLVECPHSGPAAARNAGAALAQGDYLAFTDDDCLVESDWLRQFASQLASAPSDGLVGQTVNLFPDNIPAATWQFYMDFLREHFRDEQGNSLLAMTNNVAYRRDVFERLGGFDETFPFAAGEDMEFGFRLVGNRYHLMYCPGARVWHRHRTTYSGYLAQQFHYGRGSYYFAQALQKGNYTIPRPRDENKYYSRLLRRLRSRNAPSGMWFLLALTSTVHHSGKRYETWRQRFRR